MPCDNMAHFRIESAHQTLNVITHIFVQFYFTPSILKPIGAKVHIFHFSPSFVILVGYIFSQIEINLMFHSQSVPPVISLHRE